MLSFGVSPDPTHTTCGLDGAASPAAGSLHHARLLSARTRAIRSLPQEGFVIQPNMLGVHGLLTLA